VLGKDFNTMKNAVLFICLALILTAITQSATAQVVTCTLNSGPEGGCTDETINRKCDSADDTKVCTNARTESKYDCVCKAPASSSGGGGGGKTGGSITAHQFDRAAAELLASARDRAEKGERVTAAVPIQFAPLPEVNQTTAFLPSGDVLREPTALSGGAATMRVSTTADPEVLEIGIEGLTLEAKGFSFTAVQPSVTGTLNTETGLFQVSVSIGTFETPETQRPFSWRGAAYGRYDFQTGVLHLIESGVGYYLSPDVSPLARR
jgi:hypothetical protein